MDHGSRKCKLGAADDLAPGVYFHGIVDTDLLRTMGLVLDGDGRAGDSRLGLRLMSGLSLAPVRSNRFEEDEAGSVALLSVLALGHAETRQESD